MGNGASNPFGDNNDILNLINSDGTLCDSECRRNQQLTQLQQAYETAQSTYSTAPEELETAKKNYFTFLNGSASFAQMQQTDYSSKAKKIATTMQDQFNKKYKEAVILLQSYQSSYINLSNIMELLENYKNENKHLKKVTGEISSDIDTKDRKTYYEEQSIDRLKYFYKWIKYIYIFLIIVYIFCLFLIPRQLSLQTELGILVLLIIYPFIINPIWKFVLKIYNKIVDIIPKNVYKSLGPLVLVEP